MQQALAQAQRVAQSSATVLLLGESGTGKELFAHAIHTWSARQAHPFLAVNCVALTRDLLESELFGHEKGAFTGATQLKKGKVELAQGGTVFLDEVGDMALELQVKLLRFLHSNSNFGSQEVLSLGLSLGASLDSSFSP
jgi:transcriptional regulator with PAS, ATPase and Fis domain